METFKEYLEKTGEIGYVNSLFHSIVLVSGLPGLKLGETIMTEKEERGLVYGLKKDVAEVLMLESDHLIIGQRVTRTGDFFSIYGGQGLLGRVVNPILKPLDGLGPIRGEKFKLAIEKTAPNIGQRLRIRRPLETGWMLVDILIPLGYGQRELIIGDSKTGKTVFLLDLLVNQAKKGKICIYVSIGKKAIDVKTVEEYLKEKEAIEHCVLIAGLPNQPPSLIFLAPLAGMTLAEYFRDQGKDVVLVLDDMTTHAKIYREISLLLKRSPGRNAYPGDIFHIHAALLERGGNIKVKNREVSITVFPVAETIENDISGYIQTNLLSMTDGHIFFDIDEFRKGKRPAINAFLSVSRVGKQTRTILEQSLAVWLQLRLNEHKRFLEMVQFGVELPKKTREIINLGEKIEIILHQLAGNPRPRWFQVFIIGLLRAGFWTEKPFGKVKADFENIFNLFQKGAFSELEKEMEKLRSLKELDKWMDTKISYLKEILE